MHISPIIQVYYWQIDMSSAEIEHSILPPAENAFNFLTFNIFTWLLHSIFADLDPPWRLPGSLPGHLLVFPWCFPGLEPGRKKTFNFEGTKTFDLWNEGLTSDSEGSKSQKSIQFPADQANPGKKAFNFPGVVQAFTRCCPGVSRQKKEAEASRF